jgi:hypothetical protein
MGVRRRGAIGQGDFMSWRNTAFGVVASFVMVACASQVGRAQTTQPDQTTSNATASNTVGEQAPPEVGPEAPRRPLMSLLSSTGIGQGLEKARINIFGYIEGSYQYNFSRPNPDVNADRLFDHFQTDRAYVNQINLAVERTVDLARKQWDIGGRVEAIYGTDTRFFHSNGLLDHENGASSTSLGGEYQFDLYQAYLDIGIPIGNGLRIRVGKFEFTKSVDPNSILFYTHSIAFASVFPYTLTGVTALYPISESFDIEAGISRGWGQSVKDNNDSINGLGAVTWRISDRSKLSASLIVGPELPNNNSDYTTLFDVTFTQVVSERFAFLIDALYGHQANAIAGVPPGSTVQPANPVPLGDANWYGVSGDAIYKINDFVGVTGRAEWYRDEKGYTGPPAGSIYEATFGCVITPFGRTAFPNSVKIRPEIRYDYASKPFFFDHDGSLRHDMLTIAIDVIVNF